MSKKADEALFDYEIAENGSFVIKNYNLSSSFASFLPGIAGVAGIPMWVFYVNRGQCISSLGVDNKDKAIVEFFSANRAYQLTPTTGFRTFYKIDGRDFVEAFTKPRLANAETLRQEMEIYSSGVTIREQNLRHGIATTVTYFTVPNEPLAAFARKVTVQNIGKKTVDLEILDGLPQIATYGLSHELLKSLTYLTEAWATVEGIHQRTPFYKIKVAVKDTPDVELVQSGNFFFSKMTDSSDFSEVIVDPKLIFGEDEAFIYPEKFADLENFKVPFEQRHMNLFPCAFAYRQMTLKPFEEIGFASFVGNARTPEAFESFRNRVARVPDYAARKFEENRRIIDGIQDRVLTVSSDKRLDFYARQNYLDNVLRGGMPCQLDPQDPKTLFYIYSRKHGDMERDYNFFRIPPSYYSQGNGNYRDVNQNRRNDVNIYPEVGDSVIKTFLNLLQLDGYNPLLLMGTKFFIDDEDKIRNILSRHVKDGEKIIPLIKNGYMPGELLVTLENEKAAYKTDREDFIRDLVGASERYENSEFGEGYWTDHWHYNLDLIESYLSIYPEKEKELYFEDRTYQYFEPYASVAPRTKKYFLTPRGIRQYNSIREDKDKRKLLQKRERNPYAVRTRYGQGEIYRTTLFAKLVITALNKMATLDPAGVGVEFEANRPNWYDALNGLAGMLGSSSSETYELRRLVLMLRKALDNCRIGDALPLFLPREASDFLKQLRDILADQKLDAFGRWQKCGPVKEQYRETVYNGVDGADDAVPAGDFRKLFDIMLERLDEGLARAIDQRSGLPNTYFINEVTEYDVIEETEGHTPRVMPKSFRQVPLALFLEGVVHSLRTNGPDPKKTLETHKAVLKSDLYDKKLRMFKVDASLEKESLDIGRTKVFPAGWLENESVWLHMEYKYLLELLRNGCYEEYFTTMKDVLVPFLDPKTYGRSTLENSSFIVSSAYFDKTRHGRGFYARLSGSTAEFINMWVCMTAGPKPFSVLENGELALRLRPVIPGEFFTTKTEKVVCSCGYGGKQREIIIPRDSFLFNFLGGIPVIYVNPHRFDTWAEQAAIERIRIFSPAGELLKEVFGDTVAGEWAERIRAHRDIGTIDVHFKS